MDRPNEDMTLNEIMARWPETLEVLARYGLDTCCGGALPMREAAGRHGVEPADLVEELNQVIPEVV
jgi:iron-sulfur cluster repair protein YtfE (RIC family)